MIYILLATYNGEKYISEQIESLLSQTYQNWKLWIHDDGSTDDTVKIIKDYTNKYSKKMFFFDDNVSCGGAKENFNYLINKIDNAFDYIMFCDQDDIWLSNRIELFLIKMVESEKKYKNVPLVIFSDLQIVDKNLNLLYESMVNIQKLNPIIADSFDLLKCQNVVTGCAMMLNKSALYISKPIPKEALMHDWWIALVVSLRGKNIFLNEKTILYRQHDLNSVGFNKFSFFSLIKKILVKNIYNQYKKIKIMLSYLDKEINFYDFLICKFRVLIYRILKNDR